MATHTLLDNVKKSTRMTATTLSGHLSTELFISNFEVVSNSKLFNIVQTIQQEIVRLNLENQIFISFLQKNEPQLLQPYYAVYMQQPLPHSLHAIKDTEVAAFGIVSNTQISDSVPMTDKVSVFTGTLDRGARINLNQKMELLQREMDLLQNDYDSFKKKSHARRMVLKAELEEFRLRNKEMEESKKLFEEVVVNEGRNLMTGRIAAEKFMRFMSDWMKSAHLIIEKVRLIRCTVGSKIPRLDILIDQKTLIKMNVHAVDFEEMQIRIDSLAASYEKKTKFLLEVKHMLGNISFTVNNYKQYLMGLQLQAKTLKQQTQYIRKLALRFDSEGRYVKSQLDKVCQKIEFLKELRINYSCPPIFEYLLLKKDIASIKKHIKTKLRQTNIQSVSLKLCKAKMNKLLGTHLGHIFIKICESGNEYWMLKMFKYIFLSVPTWKLDKDEEYEFEEQA